MKVLKPKYEAIAVALAQMVQTKGHGLTYALNFALNECTNNLADWNKRHSKFKSDMQEKGDDGKTLNFVVSVSPDNKNFVFIKDDNGTRKVLKGETKKYQVVEELEEGQEVIPYFAEEDLEEVEKTMQEFESEEFKLPLSKFKKAEVKKALESGAFEGLDISPLMDNLFKI